MGTKSIEIVFNVFAAEMAEFRYETVMGFKPARELAFKRRAGRTAQ